MARTLVDIPEEKLAAAQASLGTRNKRETIETALDMVNLMQRQLALLESMADDELYADLPAVLGRE